MFYHPIIDLAISFFLVFFIFSLLASAIVEVINHRRSKRQKILKLAIKKALDDPHDINWGELLYQHPAIYSFQKNEKRLPVYISSQAFANALVDTITTVSRKFEKKDKEGLEVKDVPGIPDKEKSGMEEPGVQTLEMFRKSLQFLREGSVKSLLSSFASSAKDQEQLLDKIAKWYDDYMDRVTGWYKRNARKKLFWVAAVIVILFNMDSIRLYQTFLVDEELRNMIVTRAINTVDTYREDNKGISAIVETGKDPKQIFQMADSLNREISNLNLPLGWEYVEAGEPEWMTGWLRINFGKLTFWDHVHRIVGWMISIFAISRGASFWFENLSKLVNIRSAGIKPKSQNK